MARTIETRILALEARRRKTKVVVIDRSADGSLPEAPADATLVVINELGYMLAKMEREGERLQTEIGKWLGGRAVTDAHRDQVAVQIREALESKGYTPLPDEPAIRWHLAAVMRTPRAA
jgi:hypothetical protein